MPTNCELASWQSKRNQGDGGGLQSIVQKVSCSKSSNRRQIISSPRGSIDPGFILRGILERGYIPYTVIVKSISSCPVE